jgi:hypothetical protein
VTKTEPELGKHTHQLTCQNVMHRHVPKTIHAKNKHARAQNILLLARKGLAAQYHRPNQ